MTRNASDSLLSAQEMLFQKLVRSPCRLGGTFAARLFVHCCLLWFAARRKLARCRLEASECETERAPCCRVLARPADACRRGFDAAQDLVDKIVKQTDLLPMVWRFSL